VNATQRTMTTMKNTGLTLARQLAAQHREVSGRQAFFSETSGKRGALYIYDVIGEDLFTGGGVTAKMVAEALAGMKGVTGLDVYVNSPGGDIFEAKAIHSLLRRFQGERVVHVDGIAASAATFIAMAGDRIVTAPAANWMIHEVWARAAGNAAEHRALADSLDVENKLFAETYAKRTGQSVEDVLAWMSVETWMTAAEAMERGFTDEIAGHDSAEAEVMAAFESAFSTLRACAG
jgi:ATP-dependent Clp protease, protease subunit